MYPHKSVQQMIFKLGTSANEDGSRDLRPLDDRGPLNVMFMLTSMPVGGAEILLENLVRRMSDQFRPHICCLKEAGELGEQLSEEFPFESELIHHKYDLRVLGRLKRLFRKNKIDAVVTVGAGDKMFWGRLAAKRAGIPVILSALHSTGWPDGIGKLNRLLTKITDSFIAVAKSHGEFLVDFENFPKAKVRVIPNGIDVERFRSRRYDRAKTRKELGIGESDLVCGIIAALRPEKNHLLFLRSAATTLTEFPNAKFVIVGDGQERPMLETAVNDLAIKQNVIFTGSRSDVPELLSTFDVFSLTSRNEASPVSIMEAMAMELPIVAPNVGSISDTVVHGETGMIYNTGNAEKISECWSILFEDAALRQRFGQAGRDVITTQSSLDVMVSGYESLIKEIYSRKAGLAKSDTSLDSNNEFNSSCTSTDTVASSTAI